MGTHRLLLLLQLDPVPQSSDLLPQTPCSHIDQVQDNPHIIDFSILDMKFLYFIFNLHQIIKIYLGKMIAIGLRQKIAIVMAPIQNGSNTQRQHMPNPFTTFKIV